MLKSIKSGYLLGVVLWWLFGMSWAYAANNQVINCLQLQAENAAQMVAKNTISTAQQTLLDLGFNPEKVDGLLGPITKGALAEYCKVDAQYHHWSRILATADFKKWLTRQPEQKTYQENLRSGNAQKILLVLDAYTKSTERLPVSWASENVISYQLSKSDFEALKNAGGAFGQVEVLLGKSYATQGEFRTALQKALKDVTQADTYLDMVLFDEQVGLMLTAESFKNLKVANLPSYVQQAVLPLQDLNYPDDALDGAIAKALDGLANKLLAFKPEVIKLAEISPVGASFTDESLKKFSAAHKDDELAALVLARLQFMKTVQYQNDKTISTAVSNVLTQLADEIKAQQSTILNHAEVVSTYQLTPESVQLLEQELHSMKIDDVYLALMQSMQDVDYIHEDLFWQAVLSRVGLFSKHDTLRETIHKVLHQQQAKAVTDELLNNLKAEKKIPAILLAKLRPLLNQEPVGSTGVLEEQILAIFKQLSKDIEPYRALIVTQAKKVHHFNPDKTVQWSGAGCNCVKQNLVGTVYGLYPYWLASDKVQEIQFSLQQRVGFLGLSFDDYGNVPNAAKWQAMDKKFIQEARRYGTKVDLVVQRDLWQGWPMLSATEKKIAFENLANNLVLLINTPLDDWFSKVQPWLSLGTAKKPTLADGVTLYFDNYPTDKESVDAFKEFVRALHESFKGTSHAINIMFRSSEIGRGIFQYNSLLEIVNMKIKNNNQGSKVSTHLIVLIKEPISNDRKWLISEVEKSIDGEDRMKLLRHITTVVTFDGRNTEQLSDDVIYAADNYGGVGFFPQVISDPEVYKVLRKYYLDEAKANSHFVQSVCHVVCPNKWSFRFGLGVSLSLVIFCTVMYFRVCEWKQFMDRYFLYYIILIVVPTILIALALLFCDPALIKISHGNGPLILLVVAGVAYFVWNDYHQRSKVNLP